MKKQTNLLSLITSTILLSFILSSCSKNANDEVIPEAELVTTRFDMKAVETELVKLKETFPQELNRNARVSSQLSESAAKESLKPLKDALIPLFKKYEIDLEAETPANEADIIGAGLCLYLHEIELQNKRAKVTGSPGSCALNALGLKGLVEGGFNKATAKYAAKTLLKRAVPYVGWGLAAAEFAWCMYE